MNKFLIGMVAIIMLLSTAFMGCIDRNGDGKANMVLEPSDNTTSIGALVYVMVYMEPEGKVSGAQFSMTYNKDIFSCNGVLIWDGVYGGGYYHFDPDIDNSNGRIEGFALCTLGEDVLFDNDTMIAIVIFSAIQTGVGEFELYDVVVGDSNGKEVPVKTTVTQIEVI